MHAMQEVVKGERAREGTHSAQATACAVVSIPATTTPAQCAISFSRDHSFPAHCSVAHSVPSTHLVGTSLLRCALPDVQHEVRTGISTTVRSNCP